jgi:tripartite-type tricarboxylate transporter receptor subunit TctC
LTLDESGLPGFSITAWIGVVAPKGTPKDIVQKLNLEIGRALDDSEFARQISTMGIDPLGSTPDESRLFYARKFHVGNKPCRMPMSKLRGFIDLR